MLYKTSIKSSVLLVAFLIPLFNISFFFKFRSTLRLTVFWEKKKKKGHLIVSKEQCKGEITPGLDKRRNARLKAKYEFLLHSQSSLERLRVKLMREIWLI